MKRCTSCGGKFGMTRRHYRGGEFCSLKCLTVWVQKVDEELRRRRAGISLFALFFHPPNTH